MSVYRRPGAAFYSYDFRIRGHRFSGSTGEAAQRAAERVESEIKRARRRELEDERRTRKSGMTWGEATERYWLEIGQHHKGAVDTLRALEWLTREIGNNALIASVDDAVVARLVAKRRAETVHSSRRHGKPKATPRPVSAATVNRSVTEPLRKVLRRAAKVWKKPGLEEIDWREHLLREPKELVREASGERQRRLLARMPEGYRDALQFAFMIGARKGEIVGKHDPEQGLTWPRVDFFGREVTLLGKGGKVRIVPLTDEAFDLLWSLRGHDPLFVFTYPARRTLKPSAAAPGLRRGRIKGRRYPLTYSGLTAAWEDARAKEGISDFRFHDTRHTVATRVLRKSNLKVVQQLLGHEDIATTVKYAHALRDDLRAALEAATPTENYHAGGEAEAKSLKDKSA